MDFPSNLNINTADMKSKYSAAIARMKSKNYSKAAGILTVAGFVGMVSAAYTANHIKKSGQMSGNSDLESAHNWATLAAVVLAGVTVGGGVALIRAAKRP